MKSKNNAPKSKLNGIKVFNISESLMKYITKTVFVGALG